VDGWIVYERLDQTGHPTTVTAKVFSQKPTGPIHISQKDHQTHPVSPQSPHPCSNCIVADSQFRLLTSSIEQQAILNPYITRNQISGLNSKQLATSNSKGFNSSGSTSFPESSALRSRIRLSDYLAQGKEIEVWDQKLK
jgi:hypothetical protein